MDLDISQKIASKHTKSIKKWPLKIQASFLRQVGELQQEGFSLQEIMKLMPLLLPKQKVALEWVAKRLQQGLRMDELLLQVGYSESVCSQLYLSQQNGSFATSCVAIGNYLTQRDRQTKKLRQVMIYPSVLIVFLVVMIVLIRHLLLGQLMEMVHVESLEGHVALYVVWNAFVQLPLILTVVSGGLVFSAIGVSLYWRTLSKLKRAFVLTRMPLIGKLMQQYYTFLYAREFSYFLGNGQSLLTMVAQMSQEGTSRLTKEMAATIDSQLRNGDSFSQAVTQLRLFQPELILLLVEGELSSRLDVQLQQFSKNTFELFQQTMERKITLIQPILFIGIGLVIMAMYMILLLPTMTMIGGI